MQLQSYQTKLIRDGDSLEKIISESLPLLGERSIVIIASKIIATCEGRFVKKLTGTRDEKHELVKKEAEYYLPASDSRYDIMLTIKGNWMFANAGLDESNADNQYLLWPSDPQRSANQLWNFLRRKFSLEKVGVIVTDSHSLPLNWGVTGHGIAACGFNPLYSYVNKPDLYGRPMKMEQTNIVQSIAAVASVVMGEGSERTPLAVASELPESVVFTDHEPTEEELAELHIDVTDDIYAPLLTAVKWQKGGNGKR